MGLPERAEQFDILKVMKTFFEPQLIALGLSSDQIGRRQTKDELEQSLERVNEAIQHPSSFGTLRLKMTADRGWTIGRTNFDSNVEEVNILPLLLERKKLILDHLRNLRINEEFSEVQNATKSPEQKGLAEEEGHQLKELEANLKKQQDQLRESAEAQKLEELKANLALADLQARAEIDMKKAKARSEIWQLWLARESVASIVGGSLLVLITIILLIAMFFKLAIPEIISNSFLVILGYFFGQATSSVLARAKTKVDESSQENDASHKS